MNLARQINEKLDEISRHNQERNAVEADFQDPNFTLKSVESGEQVTKEMVLNKADEVYEIMIGDLNKLTNSGQNCRDIFTNEYYINDFSQDKAIAEEVRANKLAIEEAKQNKHNN
tara:strand:+ start:954 stop:1298 length:345 start_codon:yes stop_codon:yes gene_type:complete